MGTLAERTAVGNAAAAAPPPFMIPKPSRNHYSSNCCYNSGSSTFAAAVRWRPRRRRQLLSPPHARALPQLLLLRRPLLPSTANKPRPLPAKPSPQRTVVVDAPDDDGDKRSIGDVKTPSCTPTDVLTLMDGLRLPVEADLYVSLIKECTASKDAAQGAIVCAHIRRSCPGLLRRPAGLLLANRLLLMYAACGEPAIARQIFDQMPLRDAASWAVVIAALSAKDRHMDAMRLFVEMCARTDGRLPVLEPGVCWVYALVTVLRSCAQARELGFGRQVHGLALKVLGGSNAVLLGHVDSLIQFYSILGHHKSAVEVFERTRSRSAAAWTCIITGYCREGQFKEAIAVFREMGRAGQRRNCYAFSSTLAACAKIQDDGWSGKQVHASAIKLGTNSDRFVCSSLVDMYMKHELPTEAQRAFDMINRLRDSVCWNTLLIGYARRGCGVEAVKLLYEMKAAGIEPQESIVHEVTMAFDGCRTGA